jgi:hypothetical protein
LAPRSPAIAMIEIPRFSMIVYILTTMRRSHSIPRPILGSNT